MEERSEDFLESEENVHIVPSQPKNELESNENDIEMPNIEEEEKKPQTTNEHTNEQFEIINAKDPQFEFQEKRPKGASLCLPKPKCKISLRACAPMLKGKHHEYPVKGEDDEGGFDTFRRYSEFYSLILILRQNWPGMYIPPLPPKKFFGNKEAGFVEERKHFLDLFCQKIVLYPFLFFSNEMKLFFRSSNDFRKEAKTIGPPNYENVLNKYCESLSVDPNSFEESEMEEDDSSLVMHNKHSEEYVALFKKLHIIATDTKRMKLNESRTYVKFCQTLHAYEKEQILQYADEDYDKLILGNPANASNFKLLEVETNEVVEPFQLIEFWSKEEVYEVKAFKNALKSLEKLKENLKKIERQKASNIQTISKLEQGKATIKTIFSNKAKKEAELKHLQESIPNLNKEIHTLKNLIKISTRYLRDIFLPYFRKTQLQAYYRAIKIFGQGQINFSGKLSHVWTSFVNDPNLADEIIE